MRRSRRGRGAAPGSRYCADPARIGIDPGIERVCRDAAFGLAQAGATVEEIDLDLSAARPAFLALRGLWFVTHMTPRLDQAHRFGPNVANNVRAGLETSTRDLAAAEQERGRIWQTFRELFARFDHIVTPCMAVPPFPVEQNYPDAIAGKPMQTYVDWIAPTFVLSLTGLPVASVPCGIDEGGMPVGLQVAGRPAGEEAVLALARGSAAADPSPPHHKALSRGYHAWRSRPDALELGITSQVAGRQGHRTDQPASAGLAALAMDSCPGRPTGSGVLIAPVR